MLQIDFRRATRTFDYYQLKMLRQIVIATDYLRPCLSSISLIVIHAHMKSRASANDYLASHVGFGLQQYGIHIDSRFESACLGLHCLRASDFSAAATNRGI